MKTVDNFWCTTSILIKLKRLFTTRSLKLLSLSATVLTCLPCLVQQIRDASNKSFLLSPSSLNFSFQVCTVHEKSILPASLLALEEASVLRWLTQYALLLSVFPLLCLLLLLHFHPSWLLYHVPGRRRLDTTCPTLNSFLIAFLVLTSFVIYLTISPHKKYLPFL